MVMANNEGTAPSVPEAPEDKELKEIYQEYLQKCCEVGQITYNLDQLHSQRLELEKTLDVTQRAVKNAAQKHRDLQKSKLAKLKPTTETAKLEMNGEAKH